MPQLFKIRTSVQVANAHPDTVWVRVRSERFTEYSSRRSVKSKIGAEIPSTGVDMGISEDFSGDVTCQATYALRIEEGYVAVPSQGIATFRPAKNFTETVYMSVHTVDSVSGEEVELATDVPSRGHTAVIVTSGSGVVNAKRRAKPWVDINGTNHFSKKVGKSVKGSQADFLLGCMTDELSKLRIDVSNLQKQSDVTDVNEMTNIVNRLSNAVEELKSGLPLQG